MNHSLEWEDAGMAGLRCNVNGVRKDAGTVSAGEPKVCPVCGTTVTLIWDVRLVEGKAKRTGAGVVGRDDVLGGSQ